MVTFLNILKAFFIRHSSDSRQSMKRRILTERLTEIYIQSDNNVIHQDLEFFYTGIIILRLHNVCTADTIFIILLKYSIAFG